jgi:hypothetical protein
MHLAKKVHPITKHLVNNFFEVPIQMVPCYTTLLYQHVSSPFFVMLELA